MRHLLIVLLLVVLMTGCDDTDILHTTYFGGDTILIEFRYQVVDKNKDTYWYTEEFIVTDPRFWPGTHQYRYKAFDLLSLIVEDYYKEGAVKVWVDIWKLKNPDKKYRHQYHQGEFIYTCDDYKEEAPYNWN